MKEKIYIILEEIHAAQNAINYLKKTLPKMVKYFIILLIFIMFFIYITRDIDKESMPKSIQYMTYIIEFSPLLMVSAYIAMMLSFKMKYLECKIKLKSKFNISNGKLKHLQK